MKLNEALSFSTRNGFEGDLSDPQLFGGIAAGLGIGAIKSIKDWIRRSRYQSKLLDVFIQENMRPELMERVVPELQEDIESVVTEDELDQIDRRILRVNEEINRVRTQIDSFVDRMYDQPPTRFEKIFGHSELRDRRFVKRGIRQMLEHTTRFLQQASMDRRSDIINEK